MTEQALLNHALNYAKNAPFYAKYGTALSLEDITHDDIQKALSRENVVNNSPKRGEVVFEMESFGGLSAFRKALIADEVPAPENLEKVSLRDAGYITRTDCMGEGKVAARQFVVTLKIGGKWCTLPHYLVFVAERSFALPASMPLASAKKLAGMLSDKWLLGLDISPKAYKAASKYQMGNNAQPSKEEIEKMRAVVMAFDAKEAKEAEQAEQAEQAEVTQG